MQIPKRRGDWKRQLGPADEYLTAEAIKQLEQDVKRLEQSLPAAVEELRRTKEMGDLSENAAYAEAKGRVLRMESAIFHIKERLKFAKLIPASTGGQIVIGSTVEVEVNGKIKKLQILGTQESDPSAGKISYHSPVGSALLGKKAGDTAYVLIDNKKIAYRIVAVH